MKQYPKKVYLSASWHDTDVDDTLLRFVVSALAAEDLTVVGDHLDYKRDDPFRRPWTARVHQLVADCSAVVAILPERNSEQTTAVNMFPELLAAASHRIPLLLFCHQGVQVKKTQTGTGSNLLFGKGRGKALKPLDIFNATITSESIDPLLSGVSRLELPNIPYIDGPYKILGMDSRVVKKFADVHVKSIKGSFVFNILPFALKDREHVEISKAVFAETGLPCRIALDEIGKTQEMRGQWKKLLENAEFVIAELSHVRDACLFESGVVIGLKKKVFILAKGIAPTLPYGLDDTPLVVYRSLDDLRKQVQERCCAEYKRKVYNLDPKVVSVESGNGGIPDWYDSAPKMSDATRFDIACWMVSFAVAFFLWALLVWIGGNDSPRAFISLAVSVVIGLGSRTRQVREFLENKLIERVQLVLGLSLTTLVLAFVTLAVSYSVADPKLPSNTLNRSSD